MKIIDAHAHVVQYIAGFTSRGELRGVGGGRARYADGSEFQMIPEKFGGSFTADDMISVMDGNGVEKAVLLQGQFFGFQNEYTAEAVKKYPNRLIGAGSYDPFCAKAEDVKRRLFHELGFKAVKFEVSNGSGLMAYHLPIDLDGEVMNACYRHAADNGLNGYRPSAQLLLAGRRACRRRKKVPVGNFRYMPSARAPAHRRCPSRRGAFKAGAPERLLRPRLARLQPAARNLSLSDGCGAPRNGKAGGGV